MKNYLLLMLFICGLSSCNNQGITDKIVEASCGQCQFTMQGKGCDLAIRMGDKSYYVKGTTIDDHGDAHAEDGFCEAIRKAKVSGTVVDGVFEATSFELIE